MSGVFGSNDCCRNSRTGGRYHILLAEVTGRMRSYCLVRRLLIVLSV